MTQDSAASGELHVRNEHANLQYRINGIMLPDGVGAFGQILDTKIVGSMSLLTGALPAQYGLRTAGVLDIQTNPNVFNNSGSISVYGGSHGTITSNLEYGGTVGQTQYYVSGSYFGGNLGIENPTPNKNAIHDHTDQGKGFVYLSTLLDETSRIVFIGGSSNSSYQILNNPGQPAAFGNVPAPYDSAFLNERQTENNEFGILAYQKSIDGLDMQFAAFTRYSELHFMPDVPGDLAFNGVASDVYRRSQTTGISSDNAYRWSDSHTARFGFQISGERSLVNNVSTVFNVDNAGDPIVGSGSPFSFIDSSSKLGWLASAYVSDEWRDHQSADADHRPALRSNVVLHRCKPAQSTRQPDLQAVRGNDLPRGLRQKFHAAPAGAGCANQPRSCQRHHPAAGSEPERSGPTGTIERFRCRRHAKGVAGIGCQDRRLLQDSAQSTR